MMQIKNRQYINPLNINYFMTNISENFQNPLFNTIQ